ncbi:type II secretion system protein GspC [Colwellia sp. 20A7]|uniref:type II secretion system protein GspC n=1 Tax=Colwellia sp. 20A7 TaxID=2689569 RepID=UPI0013572033|nr:type II secretion system protein GspC [Colwellia sp. 20A7]
MTLTNNFTSLSAALAKLPQRTIAQAMSVLLLIYIAFILAKITWMIMPTAGQSIGNKNAGNLSAAQRQAQNQLQGNKVDLSQLQSLHLFGEYNQVAKTQTIEEITSAPETRLQLTLSGLVASDNMAIAAAVIEHNKKQATYGIDDIIEGTRATLEKVLIDRVIIKQSGRLETLMLDGADYNQPAQSVSHKKAHNANAAERSGPKVAPEKGTVIDQRKNDNLKQAAQQLRNDLNNNPGKITDYLRITPARKNGQISGYRLSPGKSPEFFALSGLKSGDVATQMNGHDLLVPLEAAQAMSALKTAQNISLLVERNNELIEIMFSIE